MSTAGIMERSINLEKKGLKCPHTRNSRENCYSSKLQLGTLSHIIVYCLNNYSACETYKRLKEEGQISW